MIFLLCYVVKKGVAKIRPRRYANKQTFTHFRGGVNGFFFRFRHIAVTCSLVNLHRLIRSGFTRATIYTT